MVANIKGTIKGILPGLLIAILISILSIFLAKIVPSIGSAPLSIILGIILGNTLFNNKKYSTGYKFAETNLLSYSIFLLGGTLSISTLTGLGIIGIVFIVIQMIITLHFVLYMGKRLGLSDNFRFLMASGNAVCGSSAVAAVAPVIDAEDEEKGIVITIVNLTGIVLMFLIPLITQVLYNHEVIKTSAMMGGVLQSVGQVVASGAMISENVKDMAMIFKIVRIIFLVVVVIYLGNLKQNISESENLTNKEEKVKSKVKVPWYVIGFFIMCILYSLNIITEDLSTVFKEVSNKLELIALAGIGLRVNISQLIKQGKVASIYGLSIGFVQLVSAMALIRFLF